MGRYRAYPDYKDSGVDWFDSAPVHWEIKRISYVAQLRSGDAIVSEQIEAEGEYPVFGGNGLRGYTNNYTHEGRYILIGRQGALCGNINYGDGKFWASEHAVVVYPFLPVHTKWLGETLRAMNLNQYNVSAAQPGLAVANITCLKIPFPTYSEQVAIASFLDHETAKIDSLIEQQQKLIQLLKEKRQAVISQAVTKGLNPDAPMKDSGVEWLGEVPGHWGVMRLKQLVRAPLMYGANEAALDTDIECPRFIRITDVLPDGTLKSDTFRSLSEELAKPYLLSEGDVLLARTGGTVGKSFMYSTSWGRCCFAGYLIKASLNQNLVMAEWFYQYTSTQYYWEWIASNQIQATLPNVSADKYNNLVLAVPPVSEQGSILSYLNKSVDLLNDLENKALVAIALMRERRTALISAAVTGKIDVRGWQAPIANH
ncbi:MAG TPA: restriction endonuclease subunit S [Cellvibrio sp.]|nr:restriction endonuclease subunit S [Cellvibrio sp.]